MTNNTTLRLYTLDADFKLDWFDVESDLKMDKSGFEYYKIVSGKEDGVSGKIWKSWLDTSYCTSRYELGLKVMGIANALIDDLDVLDEAREDLVMDMIEPVYGDEGYSDKAQLQIDQHIDEAMCAV